MAKNNAKNAGKPANDSVSSDPRFAAIYKDPRFKLPKKKQVRGDIDDRFKSALDTDQRFQSKTTIDKYGRKVKKVDVKEKLKHLYNLEDEEETKPEEDQDLEDAEDAEEDEDEDSEEEDEKNVKLDRMRGEGMSDLSSSEEEDSDEDIDMAPEATVDEYELARDVPQGDATRRIAVVNLDWDNVRAVDLMATFTSFAPTGTRVVRVAIYPSEYGKKRMAEEELNGPPRDLFDAKEEETPKKASKKRNDVEENDDDQDYNSSKLRRYQLQRLQYYYAVVECDSVACASSIYDQCDGTEYESTANFFDLRYIPDGVDFDDEPRDSADKVPANYQPNNSFATDALQHSKVKLTWDETPKERTKFTAKAFSRHELEDMDVKAYLASDSESETENTAEKYRSLIGNPRAAKGDDEDESGDDIDMEITFNPVLEGKEAKLEIVDKAAPSLDDENLTTIERYRLKEKDRRRQRLEKYKARKEEEEASKEAKDATNKAEMELLLMDDDAAADITSTKDKAKSGKKITKTKAKKLALEEAEAEFDTGDSRFQGLFEDPDFAIDSTAPQFKKTKAMEQVLSERRQRQAKAGVEGPVKKKAKVTRPVDGVNDIVARLKQKSRTK